MGAEDRAARSETSVTARINGRGGRVASGTVPVIRDMARQAAMGKAVTDRAVTDKVLTGKVATAKGIRADSSGARASSAPRGFRVGTAKADSVLGSREATGGVGMARVAMAKAGRGRAHTARRAANSRAARGGEAGSSAGA